jgi:hypothetical protein
VEWGEKFKNNRTPLGARNDGLSYYYDDHDENHGYRSFVIGATPIFIKDLPRVKTKAIEKIETNNKNKNQKEQKKEKPRSKWDMVVPPENIRSNRLTRRDAMDPF